MIGQPISNERLNAMTSNGMLLDVNASTKIKKYHKHTTNISF